MNPAEPSECPHYSDWHSGNPPLKFEFSLNDLTDCVLTAPGQSSLEIRTSSLMLSLSRDEIPLANVNFAGSSAIIHVPPTRAKGVDQKTWLGDSKTRYDPTFP